MKNIIFDLGHVLVNFHPQVFLENHVPEEKQEKIYQLIFKGAEWLDLDRGTITLEEALASFIRKAPEEESLLRDIFPNYLLECLSPNEENMELVYRLKEKGYRLYVLSNFHQYLFESIEKAWPVFQEFDGKVVSCYCHLMKPEREIYELLVQEYSLEEKDSVFVDDKIENIQAAEALGITGIHLPVQKELKEKLKKFL